MMKRLAILFLVAAAFLSGCAKSAVVGTNDSNKRYLEAYIQTFYPNATKTSLGSYVISSTPGTGAYVGDVENSPYVRVMYSVRDLDGNVAATTEKTLAQRVGLFEEGTNQYFGPITWNRQDYGLTAGIEELVGKMNVGGTVDAIIPGWLLTTDVYDTAEEYESNSTGSTLRYSLSVLERITDIQKWELDSLCSYLLHNIPDKSPSDSLEYGLYYKTTKAPTDTARYEPDSTFNINYIGRLLNGVVFDTNIKDSAKYYGIYSDAGSYAPVEIKMAEEYTDITFGGSSVINGFSRVLKDMRRNESGTAVFISDWGYSSVGSEPSIPAYSPIRFDIEIVDDSTE